MLRSRVARDKWVGQMGISSKVKNLRWVSNLGVGVLCDVDGRNNLVLLEEVADGEAETRVVDTPFCRGGGGALDTEKRLLRVSVMCSVLPSKMILPILLMCTREDRMM